MTKDELRKHCEQACNRYRSAYINGNFDKVDKTYEEHKLVLKLLDQEESVVKALEDVRTEIAEYGSIWVEYTIKGHTDRDIQKTIEDVLKQAKTQVLESIDRKIKEYTHET